MKSRPISIWKFKNRTKCRFLKEHKSALSIDLTTVRHLYHCLTRRNFSIFYSPSFSLYLIPPLTGTFLELQNHNFFFKLRYHHFSEPTLKIPKFYPSTETGTTVNGHRRNHDSWLLIDDRYSTFCSRKWCNMNESMNPPKLSPIKLIYIIDLFRIQILKSWKHKNPSNPVFIISATFWISNFLKAQPFWK